MKYRVTDTRAQIALGRQPQTTIHNLGPSTIYLSEDPNVSTEVGFPLQVGNSINWNRDVEVWASTNDGLVSWLVTTPFGGVNVGAYTYARNELHNSTRPFSANQFTYGGYEIRSEMLECGYANSINIELGYRGLSGEEYMLHPFEGFNVGPHAVEIYWYDTNNVRLSFDKIYPWVMPGLPDSSFWDGNGLQTTHVEVPVRGAYCQILYYHFKEAMEDFGYIRGGEIGMRVWASSHDIPSSRHWVTAHGRNKNVWNANTHNPYYASWVMQKPPPPTQLVSDPHSQGVSFTLNYVPANSQLFRIILPSVSEYVSIAGTSNLAYTDSLNSAIVIKSLGTIETFAGAMYMDQGKGAFYKEFLLPTSSRLSLVYYHNFTTDHNIQFNVTFGKR